MVSISGCDPLDPGSNPGAVILFLFFGTKLFDELDSTQANQGGIARWKRARGLGQVAEREPLWKRT